MKQKVLALSEADRAALAEIVKKGQDWRMRHQAQTLLYFSKGCSAKDIATRQDLHSRVRQQTAIFLGFPSPVRICSTGTSHVVKYGRRGFP